MTSTETTPPHDSMQWSDGYLLGYGPIDAVHEDFVELLGRRKAPTTTR